MIVVIAVAMIVTVAMIVAVTVAWVGACRAMLVRMRGRLEPTDAPRKRESGNERCGESQPVVRVELQLRQQVRGRDAKEGACTERERKPEHA